MEMAAEEGHASNSPANPGNVEEAVHPSGRRMSHFKEYKFFRSFSAKVEKWPMRKAEALWRRMRERKIAGMNFLDLRTFIPDNKKGEHILNIWPLWLCSQIMRLILWLLIYSV